jgi:hypothetical protein
MFLPTNRLFWKAKILAEGPESIDSNDRHPYRDFPTIAGSSQDDIFQQPSAAPRVPKRKPHGPGGGGPAELS